jgi:pimeloyl-ACP methyl ester carboxylesterase
MIRALYFNGLGSGKTRKREWFAMRYLAKHGIQVEHISIDWRSDEPFEELLERLVSLTRHKLEEHGKLVLIGSSAGGSLALNIFRKINNKNLSVVTICSRLHDARLARWDRRTLERMAYIGTLKASPLFVDSVAYCTNQTIPGFTKTDKQRVIIVRQLADDVVPKRTMEIEGIKIHKVFAIGHGWGIAEGIRQLPHILEAPYRNSQTRKHE